MSDATIIIIAAVSALAVAVVCLLATVSRANDEQPASASADDWWRDAERIKAAVKVAQDEGIERAKLPRMDD